MSKRMVHSKLLQWGSDKWSYYSGDLTNEHPNIVNIRESIFSQKIWICEGAKSKFGLRFTAKLLLPQTKLPPSSELFWIKIHPLLVSLEIGLCVLMFAEILAEIHHSYNTILGFIWKFSKPKSYRKINLIIELGESQPWILKMNFNCECYKVRIKMLDCFIIVMVK